MRRQQPSPYWLLILTIILANVLIDRDAGAQSQFTLSAGAWIPNLPDYESALFGEEATPSGPHEGLFKNDQEDLGGQLTLTYWYCFAGTRTMFESDLQVAGVSSFDSRKLMGDPNVTHTLWYPSLDGAESESTADGESLDMAVDSNVFHLHKYQGLRDRFDLDWLGLGRLTIGCGFSYMLFDQDFQTNAYFGNGATAHATEDLDTTFYGCEFRSTLMQPIHGQMFYFDARFGIYEMDADYAGVSNLKATPAAAVIQKSVADSLSESTITFDVGVRTDMYIAGHLCRPMFGFKYFDDMAKIDHPVGIGAGRTTLSTDDAYIFNASLEFVY